MRFRSYIIAMMPLFYASADGASGAASSKPDLVLSAKVTRISPAPRQPRVVATWVVETRVLKVLRGTFDGKTFAFRVHSPSRSNLAVGQVITVEAWRVPEGWRVPDNKRY